MNNKCWLIDWLIAKHHTARPGMGRSGPQPHFWQPYISQFSPNFNTRPRLFANPGSGPAVNSIQSLQVTETIFPPNLTLSSLSLITYPHIGLTSFWKKKIVIFMPIPGYRHFFRTCYWERLSKPSCHDGSRQKINMTHDLSQMPYNWKVLIINHIHVRFGSSSSAKVNKNFSFDTSIYQKFVYVPLYS